MNDFVLFGMSFPRVMLPILLGYVVYRIIMIFIPFMAWWQGVWHKPLFNLSLYCISVSVLYILVM